MAGDRKITWDLIANDKVSPGARRAGDAFDNLGDDARDAARDVRTLDGEIDRVQNRLRKLAGEFARTGDLDLKKKFAVESRQLAGLKKMRDVLGDIAGQVAQTGTRGINVLGGAFASLPPQAQAGVAAAAAAVGVMFSSAIGAAVTAGILLGVGGGALAAGIAAAAQSTKVKGAFGQLREQAKAAFADFGTNFEAPLVRAAGTFHDALDRMSPALGRIGQALAPVIDKLAPALASMAEQAMPGIERAVKASVPLFEELARHAPQIGAAISLFFTAVAEGGPGAVKFFRVLLTAITGTIVVVGALLVALSDTFSFLYDATAAAVKVFKGLAVGVLVAFGRILAGAEMAFGWMPGIGPKLRAARTQFDRFATGVIGSLNRIPKEKRVKATLETRGAMSAARALRQIINSLRSRHVVVSGTVRWTHRGLHVPGGTILAGNQRWGGVYQHAQQGLVNAQTFSAMAPARYAFAEPATGGEAFIPRRGNRTRSLSILNQAANWYGAQVTPAGGAATVNVYAGWVASPQQLRDEITKVLDDLRRRGRT